MAHVVGESEAWASVRASLQEKRLQVSVPAELTLLLHTLRHRYEQGLEPLYEAFDRKIAANEAALAAAQDGLSSEIARQTEPLLEEARQIARKLAENQSAAWLRRFTALLLPTLQLTLRKRAVYASKDKVTAALHNDLLSRRQKQDYNRQNRSKIVAERHWKYGDQAAFVEQVLNSPELAGAEAELNILACLRELPDSYHVYCDLNLRAHRSIRFAGEYLQSAQIDYLVVGPTGVFVLEVKRWSRQFIAQGDYFDPYQQVGRAAYLCYDLLRTYGEKTRVQSILVNCGAIPLPKGEDYHVQVVTPLDLLGSLVRYRGRTLDAAAINQAIAVLKAFSQMESAGPPSHNDRIRRCGKRRRSF